MAFGRHTAYLPSYATYSPGVVLVAEIIRDYFSNSFREFDLLGMRENGGPPRHKTCWATGLRKTVHWTGYRISGRLLPIVAGKRLKWLFRRSEHKVFSENEPCRLVL